MKREGKVKVIADVSSLGDGKNSSTFDRKREINSRSNLDSEVTVFKVLDLNDRRINRRWRRQGEM